MITGKNGAIEMENGKKMVRELQTRKDALVKQLKELNNEMENKNIDIEEYNHKKREIERELVEIMDRLTQLGFLIK